MKIEFEVKITGNNWGQSKLKFLLPYLLFYPLLSVRTDGKVTPSLGCAEHSEAHQSRPMHLLHTQSLA